MFTCKSNNFQVGNLGGNLLVISRILTVQRMAMCCGPVCLQPWMPCTGAWFKHGCFGQGTLWEHERYYGLGMDALVSVRSGNVNVIMVRAWMLWSAYAPGRVNVIMVLARMLWSAYALGTRTLLWFGHGCFGQRMLSEHERYYGLGMDALVSVWSRNTNDVLDARRRVAAKTVRPFFYTLDPKVLPNDIAVELFALLLKNSSDALSFLFWRASAWRPLKCLPSKSVGKKQLKTVCRKQ